MFFKKKKSIPKISAVIAAGGSSSRMGGADKQLLLLDDTPVIIHTLDMLEQCELIAEIILVCREELIGEYMKLCESYNIGKIKSIVSGGDTRQKSVFAGVKAAADGCEYYLIHDGARPLVTNEIIYSCINNGINYKASTASVKSKDTVKIADENGFISNTPDREYVYLTQTPQVFSKPLYDKAMELAISSGKDYTDDCQLIESLGQKVFLSLGDYQNIKITTPDDLFVAQAILDMRRYNQ